MAKFEKGRSGNPRGRPVGQAAGAKLRQAIEQRADGVLQVVIDAALGGDLQACSLLLGKVIAPLKAVAPVVTIPDSNGLSLAQRGDTVIQAVLNGSVAPDVGVMLLNGLASQAKLIEANELEKRIESIENILGKRS